MKLLVTLIFLLLAAISEAATNIAASVALTDVQAAANLCNSGDTVQIPAGSATWNGGINVNGKVVNFIGAGCGASISGTNFTWLGGTMTTITEGSMGSQAGFFLINQPTNKLLYVADFKYVGGGTAAAGCINWAPDISGGNYNNPVCVRMTRILLTNVTTTGFMPVHRVWGVVDHSAVFAPSQATLLSVSASEPNVTSNMWNETFPAVENTNCIVFEDCWLDQQATIANGVMDMYGGANAMVRYSTVYGNLGNHGTDSQGANRSTWGFRFYKNHIRSHPAYGSCTWFNCRGGTGDIHENDVVSTNAGARAEFFASLDRATGTNVTGPAVCCAPFGPIAVTNQYDGQTDIYSYPALDQVGRTGPTTYGATNTTQVQCPVYLWGSTFNGANLNTWVLQGNVTNTGIYSYIPSPERFYTEGRDIVSDTVRPGYVQLTYPHPLITAMDGGGGGGTTVPPSKSPKSLSIKRR